MRTTRLRAFALVVTTAILTSCAEESSFEPAARATSPQLVGAPEEDVIPDQYIVVFGDDVRSPAAAAREVAAAHGLKLRHTYSHTIRGFSAVVPEGRLEALRRHPHVKSVQPNRYLYIDTHERFRRARSVAAGIAAAVAAPSNLRFGVISSTEITIMWDDNSDDETGFEIQRAQGLDWPFSKIASVKANAESYLDSELSSGIEYCYRVRAVTGKGRNKQYSSYTGPACAVTLGSQPSEPPDPRPTGLDAEGVPGAVELSWNDNWDGETNYAIERCGPALYDPDQEPGCLDFRGLALVGANVTFYSDGAVSPALEYCYRVKGMREKGKKITYTEYSNVACGVPSAGAPALGGPVGLIATPISHIAVELVWTDTMTTEEGFVIERCAGNSATCDVGSFLEVGETGPNAEFYIDAVGLAANTPYTYRVRAFAGDYPPSSYPTPQEATTPADPRDTDPYACVDDGVHDDVSTQLWNIRKVKAHRNPKWQATKQAGCDLKPWLFVLDTGVEDAHLDLNLIESEDFIGSGNTADGNGHGTHVAGTAAAKDGAGDVVGVAPGTSIYSFKVCNDDGSCPLDAVLGGVEEVTIRKDANELQAMVVNLSLGGPATDDYSLEDAILASVRSGVVYAISAGNGDLGACFFPADAQYFTPARVGDDEIDGSSRMGVRLNGAIVTTASDQYDHDDNCNYGAPVTVAAPGVDILSTWLGGTYASLGGASMATAHASAAAILILQGDATVSPLLVESTIVYGLDDWTTTETDDADGRLNVEGL